MLITQANDYAARSLILLSKQPKNQVTSTREISKRLKIPRNFLAKIFQKLVKKNIIISFKGLDGGVTLNRNAEKITLKEVFQSIDGLPILRKCIFEKKVCFLSCNCMMNKVLSRIQSNIDYELKKITIANLSKSSIKRNK